MIRNKTTRYRKPDPIVLLAFFVGLGVLLTSFVQAAEPGDVKLDSNNQKSWSQQWLPSMWGLDLAARLKNWKPKIAIEESEDGLNLSRPFGTRGPALQFSTSVPERAVSSLRAGGDSLVGVRDDAPDAYLFLEKRW